MTRKDLTLIAYAMRVTKPEPNAQEQDEGFFYRILQWERDVKELTRQLQAANARFNEDAFQKACGYMLRPDGSEFVIDWSTGKAVR